MDGCRAFDMLWAPDVSTYLAVLYNTTFGKC
jgi:hypothetical protein